jgi:hypothetical protein
MLRIGCSVILTTNYASINMNLLTLPLLLILSLFFFHSQSAYLRNILLHSIEELELNKCIHFEHEQHRHLYPTTLILHEAV